jgi:hypothetical protein
MEILSFIYISRVHYCYRNMYIFRYEKYVFITVHDEFQPL